MKFLSIRQPWAHLILNEQSYAIQRYCRVGISVVAVKGFKDIENRTWATSYRGPLLIHASKKIEKMKVVEVRGGSSVLTCAYPEEPLQTGGIIGVAQLVDCTDKGITSPWWEGAFGWKLINPQPLPFSPLKGGLGLRDVSAKHLLPETVEAFEAWRKKIRGEA